MKKSIMIDLLRFVVVSFEFVAILASMYIYAGYSLYLVDAVNYFPWDAPNLIIGYFAVPLALVYGAFNYGTKFLSQHRSLLIEAGLYDRARNRVAFSNVITATTFVSSIIAFFMIKENSADYKAIGAALIVGGWSSSIISVVSLAYNDFRISEIIEVLDKSESC